MSTAAVWFVIERMETVRSIFRQGGSYATHEQLGSCRPLARGTQLRVLRVGVLQCQRRQRRNAKSANCAPPEASASSLMRRLQVRQQAVVHQFRVQLRTLRQFAVHFRRFAQFRLARHLPHQQRHVAQAFLRLQHAAFQALHVEICFGQLFRAIRACPFHVEGGTRHLALGRIEFGAVGAAVVDIPAHARFHLVRAAFHVQGAIEVIAAAPRGLQRRRREQTRAGLLVARFGGGQRRLRRDHLRIARHGARQQGGQAPRGLRLESGR